MSNAEPETRNLTAETVILGQQIFLTICPTCPGRLGFSDPEQFKNHMDNWHQQSVEQKTGAKRRCSKCFRAKPLADFSIGGRLLATCHECRGGGRGGRPWKSKKAVVEKKENIRIGRGQYD